MVKEKVKTIYSCYYCGSPFDNHNDAEECQDYCHDSHEEPTEDIQGPFFFCEMCDKKHYNYSDALDCEHGHKQKDDMYYANFTEELNRKTLEFAASHIEQVTLEVFYRESDFE